MKKLIFTDLEALFLKIFIFVSKKVLIFVKIYFMEKFLGKKLQIFGFKNKQNEGNRLYT